MEKTRWEQNRASGLNCAETMIKTYNDEHGAAIPVQAATAFGGGMSCGGTCGVAVGALMALGMAHGRQNGETPNVVRPYGKRFMDKMKAQYGTMDCRDLKKRGISCEELIGFAHEALEEILREAKDEKDG